MNIISGGKVGIGRTEPGEKLEVAGAIKSLTSAQYTGFYLHNGSNMVADLKGFDDDNDNGNLQLYDNGVVGIKIQGAGESYFNGGNVGIGTTTPGAKLDIAAGNLDLDSTTNANQFGVITKDGTRFLHDFNYGDNGTVTTVGQNTFLGLGAGNLTMGSGATQTYHSSYSTGVGYRALQADTIGYYNSALGANALFSNTTGSYNSTLGASALYSNTTGHYNSALGVNAGRYLADGSGNGTSNSSLFLGYETRSKEAGQTNEIVIGASAIGAGSNSVTLGNDSITKTLLKGNVGIGTTDPELNLYIEGDSTSVTGFYVENDNAGASRNVRRLGIGVGGSSPSVLNWVNSGYVEGQTTNGLYLGFSATTGSLRFGSSGRTTRMIITDAGNVGIGTTSPVNKLNVAGANDSSSVGDLSLIGITNTDTTNNNTIGFGFNQANASGTIQTVAGIDLVGVSHTDGAQSGALAFATRNAGSWGERLRIDPSGNVGVGTDSPSYVLDVQHASSKVNSKNGYLTNGADYAEYFENEEIIPQGALVGMNMVTGKVHKYAAGDEFIGIVSSGGGFVGNGNKDIEKDSNYTLVGLLGQLDFVKEETIIENRIVYTKDRKRIGILLSSGKVLLR